MKSSTAEMPIGELAERFGPATHVLRHWESVGVLRPGRRVNGRRRCTADHLGELDARITRLRLARRIVEHTASCPSDDFLACPRMRGLLECAATEAPEPRPPRHTARVSSSSAGTDR